MQAKDLKNLVFGKLLAKHVVLQEGKVRSWLCACSCGKELVVSTGALCSGNTKSCGCSRIVENKRHIFYKSEYRIFTAMHQRCNNKNNKAWTNYGGRGIKVCAEWSDFFVFIKDMGRRPSGFSIERKDNNGDYCPSNCHWATKLEQANNTRTNKRLTVFGDTKTIAQWVLDDRCTFKNPQAISKRLKKGWSALDSLTIPNRYKNKKTKPKQIASTVTAIK